VHIPLTGIHNEPGIRKVKVPSADKLVNEMLTAITSTSDEERGFLPFKADGKDEVILLINNLGARAEIELSVVAKEASQWLASKRISVQR
jgi:dihydroxyacetone kinase